MSQLTSQLPTAEVSLDWAKSYGNSSITSEVILAKASEPGFADIAKLNSQLQVALVSLCRDEALTVVKNSHKGQGPDAWRRLNREYEPNNPQANRRLLLKILKPPQKPLDALRAGIETWEKDCKLYANRSSES